MTNNARDISFGSFNLYNLQLPGERWRRSEYTQAEYDEKIEWSARMVQAMDADVIAFQELWSPQCLRDVFEKAGLAHRYELAFIRDSGWYDIAVAAAVRKPWVIREKTKIKEFPEGFRLIKREVDQTSSPVEDEDDDIEVVIHSFSRSLLKLTIGHADHAEVPEITCFPVHLKSKLPTNLDKPERENDKIEPHGDALGAALSTIRRTAESAALRIYLNQALQDSDTPVVVLGDCNDSPNSNTLAILTDQPNYRFYADSRVGGRSDKGLYLAGAQHQLRSFRDVHYTHIYKGEYDSLDHVLASEQFYDHSRHRVWSFREMRIWNDYLLDDGHGGCTDHGIVCARYDYNPA